MRDCTRIYLRADLCEFKQMKREIEAFRLAIMYPTKEIDENIGGGRSGFTSDPTAATAIKLVSPVELAETIKFVEIVEKMFESMDDDYEMIIRCKYIDNERAKKNFQVAQETYFSEKTVSKKDNEFLELLRLRLARR